MAAEKTVKCTQNQHSYRVCDGICQEAEDTGPPVVEDILGELAIEVVTEEAAHHREPEHEKVYYVAEGVKGFIFGAEAETHRYLAEKQETEVLQISVKEHGSQEDQTTEGPQQDGYLIFEEQLETPLQ